MNGYHISPTAGSGKVMPVLYLLRHAKSDWKNPGLTDRARPLNARGREACAIIGGYMGKRGMHPDHALISPARRAVETWQLLRHHIDPPRREELAEDAYLADWQTLADIIEDVPEGTDSAILIGHNPGMHDLALHLAGEAADPELERKFPTAALAIFSIDGPWTDFSRHARLKDFVTPRRIVRDK